MYNPRAGRRRPWIGCAAFTTGVTIVIGTSGAAGQVAVKIGAEFQVSSQTAGGRAAAIAVAATGDFVVTWESYGSGSDLDVFAQRFSSAGVRQGSELQVSSPSEYPSQPPRYPAIASDQDGDFVVVWKTLLCRYCVWHLGVYPTALYGQRFDATGVPLGAEFQVNSTPGGYHTAAIASVPGGDAIVTWQNRDGIFYDASGAVFARRLDPVDPPGGPEFQVDTATTSYRSLSPAVAVDGAGGFVVAWAKGRFFDFTRAIFAQRYDDSDAALGAEFLVNAYTGSTKGLPAVAADDAGNFVIAWQSDAQDGSGSGVFARRFDSTGTPQAVEFQVNSFTEADQYDPAIGSDGTGGFVIAWTSAGEQDGSSSGVFARRFDAAGAPQGAELQVNTSTIGSQARPAIGFDDHGGFVAVWDNGHVFAQRFRVVVPAVLDVDADGTLGALTDGVLVVRTLFGLIGGALVGGAIAPACNRCDDEAIQAHIQELDPALDIDGNGVLDALTDGILVFRYLFGLTGPALTSGAIAVDCTRCAAGAIEPYLQTLD